MYYTKDLVFEKLTAKLPDLNISEKKEKDKTIFIFNLNGHKAKIDIENFLIRLDDNQSEKSDKLLEDFLYYVENTFKTQNSFNLDSITRENFLKSCYPILRATTFAKDSDKKFLSEAHTNETKIFYAIDLDNSYKIITEEIIKHYNINFSELKNSAYKNLKKLPLKYNTDKVDGNTFYFLNAKDGYDGARLLNEDVLNYFYNKIGSEYYLGIPHQDSLIIADIKNKRGLEILQKLMVHFFTEGLVPITTITFKYDNKNLESLFIFVE